jgi:hypothetical protein
MEVHEDVLGTEMRAQAVEEPPGVPGAVVAPVTNKDACHAVPSRDLLGQLHSPPIRYDSLLSPTTFFFWCGVIHRTRSRKPTGT